MSEMKTDIREYRYKYEMHLHTKEGSLCGKNSGSEMVRAHKEAGYEGIVVTNHAWGGNTSVDRSLPYKEWVRQFSQGYYTALEEGEKVGLDVFFGWESGYNGTEFLIYGLTPEWMMEHEELWTASVERQFELVNEGGGVVIHAHPFREESYIPEIRLFPDYVHGVEIINATHSNHLSQSHNDPAFDLRAIEYANKYNLPSCAGSDVHTTMVLGGGIILKEKIKSYKEIPNIFLKDTDYILTNGDSYFDKRGNVIGL